MMKFDDESFQFIHKTIVGKFDFAYACVCHSNARSKLH